MKFPDKPSTGYHHRFDFDVGYLVKSPCKDCEQRWQFPHCVDFCQMLSGIHEKLAGSVSLSRLR